MVAQIDFKHERGSLGRAREVVTWLFERFTYVSDAKKYGKTDHWTGALTQLTKTGKVEDDCDGFGRLCMTLFSHLGGFEQADIAECIVDVNPTDNKPFDHHIAAVCAGGTWYYAHCWTGELLTEDEITNGWYKLPVGHNAVPLKIIQHRRADQSENFDGKPRKARG
ncbi:MAG: hypothetical protein JKY66_00085 [Spongiibacteraceae bacterium]|nr:hypothetical protein [Spongiibacteraceae bacterium]